MLRASVSFFNELSIEKRNYARGVHPDHGFQEDNALEGYDVKGQNCGHGFQEIFIGWKIITLEGTHVEGRDRGKEIEPPITLPKRSPCQLPDPNHQKLRSWETTPHN
jgi:hypothetical protein